MEQYKTLVKEFLSDYAHSMRKSKGMTQEGIASKLRITGRAYGDLERGKYCFSTTTLLFFLVMLEDVEIRNLLNDFIKLVNSQEPEEPDK